MHQLDINGLEKRFKDKTAVYPMNVTLKSGVYGLLGENGAGKTTLMRMLCGILQPTGGTISCDGTYIEAMDGGYRRLLGYLPQDFGYYPDFTALKFLQYMAALKALPREYTDMRIQELLELTSLTEVKDKKLKTFSGGMIKRVGIAQALLNEPEILILDEPTTGLDPRERVRFRNMISSLSKGRMVLLSTHIVSDIESIADQILLMQKGRLIQTGSVAEIEASVEGCVWECRVEEKDAKHFHETYSISNLKNEGDYVNLRIVAESRPAKEAVTVRPGLEDAYLYYLSKGGNENGTIQDGAV